MSEFNIYARKLDTAFKEARSEYNTAFRALQEAQQANRDANAWKPGDSAEEKQVRTTRAARSAPSWNRQCAPPILQTLTQSTITPLS